MKKLLTLVIATVMAFSVFGFSACGGGSSVSGEIKGNYTEVKAENYGEVAAKLDGAKSSAVRNGTAGGTLKAEEEIKLTIGGKSLTLTANEALALILNLEGAQSEDVNLSSVSGAAFNLDAELEVDKGFGSATAALANKLIELDLAGEEDNNASENQMIVAALSLIDNMDLTVEANAYVKDAKIYTDAKVQGVPAMIKQMVNGFASGAIDFAALEAGVKYVFTEEEIMAIYAMINLMFGNSDSEEMSLFAADYEEEEESGFSLDIESITAILASMGVKLYTDVAKDGSMKIKIATTADVKTNVNALIKSGLFTANASAEMAAIINSVNFSKLDIELYLAINANNVITAAAANLDVEVSANVAGTSVSFAANGALDCSLAIPEKIDYPSFSAYVSLAA